MSEHCTVYCAKSDFALAASVTERFFDAVRIDGANNAWAHIEVKGATWRLRLTSKVYREDGDDFTDLQFSTYMWVNRAKNCDAEPKQRALMSIRNCQLAIGMSVEPGFEADDRIPSFVFEIARELDGVIFNGTALLDAFGHALVPGSEPN